MLKKTCLFGVELWLSGAVAVYTAVISVAVADGVEDKRNELNQIYWRIVANKRLNDANLGKNYSWIQEFLTELKQKCTELAKVQSRYSKQFTNTRI